MTHGSEGYTRVLAGVLHHDVPASGVLKKEKRFYRPLLNYGPLEFVLSHHIQVLRDVVHPVVDDHPTVILLAVVRDLVVVY